MFEEMLRSDTGKILLSIILGFGLASLFRKVCKGGACVVIKGPNPKDVKNHYYKMDGECYTYTPYATQCDGKTISTAVTEEENTPDSS